MSLKEEHTETVKASQISPCRWYKHGYYDGTRILSLLELVQYLIILTFLRYMVDVHITADTKENIWQATNFVLETRRNYKLASFIRSVINLK